MVLNLIGCLFKKDVDFLYADDIITGGEVDLVLQRDGVLIYTKV